MGEKKTFAEMTEAEQIGEIKRMLAELEMPSSATAAATVEAILASEEES